MNKNDKKVIVKFLQFVRSELHLDNPFRVKLVTHRDAELKTYAYYDPHNNFVKVYIKNRGLADVLRSIAHELIHHLQNQRGELDKPVPDVGGKVEDEANAVAGQLVKKFGYHYPDYSIYTITL